MHRRALPNGSALVLPSSDTVAPEQDLPHETTYEAAFEDGKQLQFQVTEERKFSRFVLDEEYGDVGFEIDGDEEFPSVDKSTLGLLWFSRTHKWFKLLPRCLVAYSKYLEIRQEGLETAIYKSNVTVSPYEAGSYKPVGNAASSSTDTSTGSADDDARKLDAIVRSMLWRVAYYEKIGFKLDDEMTYAIVKAALEAEIRAAPHIGIEESELGFSGDLKTIHKTIAANYPNEKAVQLRSFEELG
jgi:hypothetical protein